MLLLRPSERILVGSEGIFLNGFLFYLGKKRKGGGYRFSDGLYSNRPSENNTDLLLFCRQAVLFGEGTQRALQNRYRAVNQTATAASGQQLAQALQGAQVV